MARNPGVIFWDSVVIFRRRKQAGPIEATLGWYQGRHEKIWENTTNYTDASTLKRNTWKATLLVTHPPVLVLALSACGPLSPAPERRPGARPGPVVGQPQADQQTIGNSPIHPLCSLSGCPGLFLPVTRPLSQSGPFGRSFISIHQRCGGLSGLFMSWSMQFVPTGRGQSQSTNLPSSSILLQHQHPTFCQFASPPVQAVLLMSQPSRLFPVGWGYIHNVS